MILLWILDVIIGICIFLIGVIYLNLTSDKSNKKVTKEITEEDEEYELRERLENKNLSFSERYDIKHRLDEIKHYKEVKALRKIANDTSKPWQERQKELDSVSYGPRTKRYIGPIEKKYIVDDLIYVLFKAQDVGNTFTSFLRKHKNINGNTDITEITKETICNCISISVDIQYRYGKHWHGYTNSTIEDCYHEIQDTCKNINDIADLVINKLKAKSNGTEL